MKCNLKSVNDLCTLLMAYDQMSFLEYDLHGNDTKIPPNVLVLKREWANSCNSNPNTIPNTNIRISSDSSTFLLPWGLEGGYNGFIVDIKRGLNLRSDHGGPLNIMTFEV